MHARTSELVALPLPRHGESAAADLGASYRALSALVLPIEGARTYAPGISTGAVAVFRAFSMPKPGGRLLWWSPHRSDHFLDLPVQVVL
jgi:hypothetical protein